MGITSYAQNFEDVMLWRALGHISNGFYLDIGAQHPEGDSVSKAFYEKGWRGVHVEALQVYVDSLRSDRPDETVLQAAVAATGGVLTFNEIPETGLSTGDLQIAARHRQQGLTVRALAVPTITLASVFDHIGLQEIHWLKIDVEGMELDVLKGWGEHNARPWIAVVESTLPNTRIETHEQWESHLLNKGYKPVYFDGLNRFYISSAHPELKDAFRAGPNLFDGFVMNAGAPICSLATERFRAQVAEVDSSIAHLQLETNRAAAAATLVQAELANQISTNELEIKRLNEVATNAANAFEADKSVLHAEQSTLRAALSDKEVQLHQECTVRDQTIATLASGKERNALEISMLKELQSETASRLLWLQEEKDRRHFEAIEAVRLQHEASARLRQVEESAAAAHTLTRELSNVLQAKKDELAAFTAQAYEDYKRLSEELELKRAENDSILQSFSWIITSPFRQASRLSIQRPNRTPSVGHGKVENVGVKSKATLSQVEATTRASGGAIAENQTIDSSHANEAGCRGQILSMSKPFHSEKILAARSLDEILSYDGEAFVQCAYVSLFGREPDSEGHNYYCARLARGISKLQVLYQLAASRELLASAHTIPGFSRAIRQWRLYCLPIVGNMFRRPEAGLNSGMQQSLRVLEFKLDQLSVGLERDFDGLDRRLVSLERSAERVVQLADGLATVRLQNSPGNPASGLGGPIATEVLGSPNTEYFLNLSTSNHWRANLVGIVRVERELAKFLTKYRNVKFVVWDATSSSLKLLNREQVRDILSDAWCDNKNAKLVKFEPQNLESVMPRVSDTFVSLGLDWDLSPTADLANYLKPAGAKLVLACYDLVPILFPEFAVRDGLDQMFKRHFVDVGHSASEVFTISMASKHDLEAFWTAAVLETQLPRIQVVTLASDMSAVHLPPLARADSATLQDVLDRGNFVIYVSTLEARKNHRLLVNIWRDLYRKRGEKCPQIVFVGMKGWGVDDLLQSVPRMPVYLAGKINWLQNVSDDLLHHLYSHAQFSVFPSLYEGWGLAATEAMSFGKICVASNNSALPESTQGLMPSFHPLDYLGWKTEIEHLCDDSAYRASLEAKIQSHFQPADWKGFAEAFCERLLTAKPQNSSRIAR